MTEHQLEEIANWFDAFVAAFSAESPWDQRNYDLKVDHTLRVRRVIDRLAAALKLPPGDRALASAIAICHDIGRFPQYRDYRTFNDATSVNHAALGVQTLSGDGILRILDEDDRTALLQAVALHNAFLLPGHPDPRVIPFVMLIRDADKLDIWRVMIEYFRSPPAERASAVIWDLPDTGACSSRALDEVVAGRMLNRSLLATADDFKLLQLSWVFDLNFDESFAIFAEWGYLDTLAGLLPHHDGCIKAAAVVRNHVSSRLAAATSAVDPPMGSGNGATSLANQNACNPRILMAEDDPAAQKIIPLLLKCHGYHLDVVCNGRAAIKALSRDDYALVLMDCIMPEMDGYEATAIIRDPSSAVRRHDIPVIALTGNVTKQDYDKCIAAGMNDHLPKPLNLDDLLAKLAKWLPPGHVHP